MEMRDKLIKAAAEALYADGYCAERGLRPEGCPACHSDADRRATVAVDAMAELVKNEISAVVRYLRIESVAFSSHRDVNAALAYVAEQVEKGKHHDA